MPTDASTPRSVPVRRRRLGVWALILAIAVPVGVRVAFPEKWGCVVGAVSFASVEVPPGTATPEDVVRTYLRALDAHDADTAGELYPPPNGVPSFACNVRGIEGVSVTSGVPEAGTGTVRVEAQFTIEVFDEAAAGRSNGRTGESYSLRRRDGDGPWRIVSSGRG